MDIETKLLNHKPIQFAIGLGMYGVVLEWLGVYDMGYLNLIAVISLIYFVTEFGFWFFDMAELFP